MSNGKTASGFNEELCMTTWTCLECGAANPVSNPICGSAACQLRRLNDVTCDGLSTATPVATVSSDTASATSNGVATVSSDDVATTLREGFGSKALEPTTPKKQRNSDYNDPDFLRFWEAFPHRKGKIAAAKAWQKVIASGVATADEVIEAALRYRNDPERDPKKTKYPQGWLNDGRYLDEGPAARPESHEIHETDWEAMRAEDDARVAAILAETAP